MKFGEVIAEARKKANLSQKELAARIIKEDGQNISPQYLNDIEHSRRNPPSEHMIEQFAKILGLPADILYYYAGKLAADLRDVQADDNQVIRAYSAFRRQIKGK